MFRTVASRRFYVFSARPFGADREVSYEFLIHNIVSQIGKYGFYFFQNQGNVFHFLQIKFKYDFGEVSLQRTGVEVD